MSGFACFIAMRRARPYFADMLAQCIRLLTLAALVLMPFTMASAPAEAHPGQAMATMAGDHCAGQEQDGQAPVTDMTQCMLMCVALPATELSEVEAPALPRAPLRLAAIRPIHGIILEIATPPPRFA